MDPDKSVLDDASFLNVQAKPDRFLEPRVELAQRFRLGMAAFQIGNDADIPAVLVLLYDDGKSVFLHPFRV